MVTRIHNTGGTAYYVGGYVRDKIIGREHKDIDIEVHGLTIIELQTILQDYGTVLTLGKIYGILRIAGTTIDWSLPRIDQPGRKPEVIINTHLSIQDSLARRDLTMNAIAQRINTGEIIDPFHGINDIKTATLRTPNPDFFIQDPLRFYRVMHFISRFKMKPDDTLHKLCATMDLSGISQERISAEFNKLLLDSIRPSLGLRWLASLGRIHELFPELGAMIGIKQPQQYHPEGDVFEHTMQTLDHMAWQLRCPDYTPLYWAGIPQQYTQQQKRILLYAALCHDMGKPVTTTTIDGHIRSLQHEIIGQNIARNFLHRITHEHDLVHHVVRLIRWHMQPGQFGATNVSDAAYKKLASRLTPSTFTELLELACADYSARQNTTTKNIKGYCGWILYAAAATIHRLTIMQEPIKSLLNGHDLMDYGFTNKALGLELKRAYKVQIEHDINDKQILVSLLGYTFKKK
jgi:tRNA nucleotidyltransferase (CCA-adding enzyme)